MAKETKDKKGVVALIPIYDGKEKELDYKTARAVGAAYVKVFISEGKALPSKIANEMLDQHIALVLVIGSSEVKDYQQTFESRHVYVAQPRNASTQNSVDGVVEKMLKKMKADGVVKALV